VPKAIRAELATLIYYPARKLPLLKARYPERFELEARDRQTLPGPKRPRGHWR